jgi:hypothetical protein
MLQISINEYDNLLRNADAIVIDEEIIVFNITYIVNDKILYIDNDKTIDYDNSLIFYDEDLNKINIIDRKTNKKILQLELKYFKRNHNE